MNTSHENSAAYTGSTFSSRMEMEAVTHAFRWFAPRQSDHTCHHPHRFNELAATKMKKKCGMESLVWNVSMVDIHLQKLLRVYCPGPAGVTGNDQTDW